MADTTFGCHTTPTSCAKICAGFLLAHSDHNLVVRLRLISGELDLGSLTDDGRALFTSYADMAIAHGVDPADEALQGVRSNSGWFVPDRR